MIFVKDGFAEDTTNNPAKVEKEDSELTDSEIISKIEKSLNEIKAIEADFIQISSNTNNVQTGHIKLQRPNNMLLTYDNPDMPRIIADGYNIIYVEDSLEQVTYLGLEDTPAVFLIKDKISFSDPKIKLLAIEDGDYQVRITAALAEDTLAGKITLIFAKPDFHLTGWEVTDAKRVKTIISLQDVQINPTLDKKQFTFINPYTDKKKKYPFLKDY